MSNSKNFIDPDILWNNLLSRQPSRIQSIYLTLDSINKKAIKKHLQRMITEIDWHAEQKLSAQIALKAIQDINLKKGIN